MNAPSVESVLSGQYVSYTGPLELARQWLQSGDQTRRADATRLLEGLFERFSHSIEIGHQLALAYLASQNKTGAQRVIRELGGLCRNPNEEVLCRLGRIARDEGDRYIACPEIGGTVDAPRDALSFYRLANKQYRQAWVIRYGHYPGINVATLHLLLASLEDDPSLRERELAECHSMVRQLLSRRENWPTEHADDPVWHLATEGEAHLLLQEWQEAARFYTAVCQNAHCAPGHLESIRRQMNRVLYAFKRLGIQPPAPFVDADTPLLKN